MGPMVVQWCIIMQRALIGAIISDRNHPLKKLPHLNLQVRSLAEVVLNSYLHQTCFDLVILWQPESHPKFKTPFPRFSVNRMNLPVVPLNRIVCWIQFVKSETSVFVKVA